jgi:hypothetical protein
MFITKFMEQSLSGEGNSHSASQILHCVWNSKVQESATESYPELDESSPHPLQFSIKKGIFLAR